MTSFSEPASIWYLLTRALVSKKYKGIIYFFLLQSLLTKRFLFKKDDFLHPQGLFQERRIPIGHNHNRQIISVPALKVTSMPQVSSKTPVQVKHLILFLKKACQFLLYKDSTGYGIEAMQNKAIEERIYFCTVVLLQ